jgi:predicted enzyme related to lactoylglutathione lyase
LDATLAELQTRAVPIFAGPMQIDRIGQRIALIRDPVGTIIELTQPVRGTAGRVGSIASWARRLP